MRKVFSPRVQISEFAHPARSFWPGPQSLVLTGLYCYVKQRPVFFALKKTGLWRFERPAARLRQQDAIDDVDDAVDSQDIGCYDVGTHGVTVAFNHRTVVDEGRYIGAGQSGSHA